MAKKVPKGFDTGQWRDATRGPWTAAFGRSESAYSACPAILIVDILLFYWLDLSLENIIRTPNHEADT